MTLSTLALRCNHCDKIIAFVDADRDFIYSVKCVECTNNSSVGVATK